MNKISRALGTCKTCKTTSAIEAEFGWGPISKRAACGHWVQHFSVTGNNRPEVHCGAKCLNAKKSACECSCGGEHHGEGWAA